MNLVNDQLVMTSEDIQEEVDSLISHRNLEIEECDDGIIEQVALMDEDLALQLAHINDTVFQQCQELIWEK